jgi:hypothetical protein
MSWYRKVKSMYSISFITISFIIWSTLSKWLFKNPVDYRLFLICLPIVFITQYLSMAKLKRTFLLMVLLGLSIFVSLIFFKGQAMILNSIFLLFMALITYSLEKVPIDYLQYKDDVNKSIFVLLIIWLISFSLGIQFINEIYKFNILYIITIIILMRETRRYVYAIKSNTSMVTNIIICISVISISLDYANVIIAKLLEIIMVIATFIFSIIIAILNIIIGGPIAAIAKKLMEITIKQKSNLKNQNTNGIGNNLIKDPDFTKYKSNELTPILILILKILILLLVLYVIYKFLSRFINKTKIYKGVAEEKEKIVNKKNKKPWVKDLFYRVFQGHKSNRDKILYLYKGFEKVTEVANIYKPYMTASQLKNVTKINVDNFDYLDEMTQVYNKAKFSIHSLTEDEVLKVKKGQSNIKKQL